MKTLQNYLTFLLMIFGLTSTAFAQRGEHHSGGSGNQSWGSGRQNNSGSSSFRQNSPSSGRQDRQTTFSQPRQSFQRSDRNNSYTSSPGFRNRYSNNSNVFVQRNNRISTTNIRGNNYSSYRTNNYVRYGGYKGSPYHSYYPNHYSYVPHRYVYSGYVHYSALPRTFLSINFGGYPYYYGNGLFYSYYNGFYEPVYAPFGITVSTLPFGYYPFYMNSIPYYYYQGTYYRDHGDNQYEVIDAPMGAVISTLPKGAKAVTVNGEKFYEFNGTYYKEETNDKNEVIYTVVGKNGEINNSDDSNVDARDQQPPLQVGDILSSLPENSRPVTINGQSLFVSPDNFYFKQRTTSDGSTSYEVVGVGSDDNGQ